MMTKIEKMMAQVMMRGELGSSIQSCMKFYLHYYNQVENTSSKD